MNCKQAKKLLDEYLDGRLKAEIAGEVEAHLGGCKDCAAEVAALRAVLQQVRTLDALPLPEGFVGRVSAAARQRAAAQPAGGKASVWPMLRWLAPAFGVLLIGLVAWWNMPFGEKAGLINDTPEAKKLIESMEKMGGGKSSPRLRMSARRAARRGKSERPAVAGQVIASGEGKFMRAGRGRRALVEAPASGLPSVTLPAPAPTGSAARGGVVLAPAEPRVDMEERAFAGKPQAAAEKAPAPKTTMTGSADAAAKQLRTLGYIGKTSPEQAPSGVRRRAEFGSQSTLHQVEGAKEKGAAAQPGDKLAYKRVLTAGSPLKLVVLKVRAVAGASNRPQITLWLETEQPKERLRVALSKEGGQAQQIWEGKLVSRRPQAVAARQIDQAGTWSVSIQEDLVLAKDELATDMSRKAVSNAGMAGPPLHHEYRLFVPARLLTVAERRISLHYKALPFEKALRNFSEKAGMVILAEAPLDSRITMQLKDAPLDRALSALAEAAEMRVETDGLVRRLKH
jgi:hypothetical protein